MAYLEFFPPEIIALQREVMRHPDLCQILAELPSDADLPERLGHIAAYCGVVVDHYMYPEEIARFADLLFMRLAEKRTCLILTH